MVKILDKNEPSKAWLPAGSATFLAIIIVIVLVIQVFPLSRNWTIGLSIVLVIAGLVVAPLTIKGWLDWRLFRDTAVESTGIVVHRFHEHHEDSYGGGMTHVYFLVVEFTNGQTSVNLKERVDGARYAATQEGSSLTVRFAPSRPELAIFQWAPQPQPLTRPRPPVTARTRARTQTQPGQPFSGLMSPKPVLISENALTQGIGVEKPGNEFRGLFEKGTTLPVERRVIFPAVRINQELLELKVIQGDYRQVLMNSPIGIFKIRPGSGSEDSPDIEVIFQVSSDGRFSLEAREAAGGRRLQVTVKWPRRA